ncbi:hypothetical protein [Spirilliplanes yamanashiensis]|nr:hypothetical protein [Spirilliplanes yamanashiensis]MDP9814817.1 GNAT superfamily N-acetyltransferase [Spirilliplanes yamanashiensis]
MADLDEPRSQAESDAMSAFGFACNVEDAGPERFAATMKVALNLYGCDAARIRAALELCRERQGDAGEEHDPRIAFLEQALQHLDAVGADTDEAGRQRFSEQLSQELFPDPQPYQWPRRVALRRWWPRRWWHQARLRFEHQLPEQPDGHHLMLLRLGRRIVGKLDYQVCDQCRRGYLRKLDVYEPYKGLGLGERTIRTILRRHPGYRWRTTVHYPTAGTFWTKMGVRFGGFEAEADGPCPHLRNGR